MPGDKELRQDIISLYHNSTMAGHGGAEKTFKLVSRYYSWEGLCSQVTDYCSRCEQCARMKPTNVPPGGKLKPNPIPEGPWQDISADFITDLPESNGFNTILVVVDRFSKEVVFIPTDKTVTALGTAKLYRDNVWKVHGLPHSLISDHGPQFAAQLMKDLEKMLKIDL